MGQVPGAAAIVQAVRLLRRLDTPFATVLKDELIVSRKPPRGEGLGRSGVVQLVCPRACVPEGEQGRV